jgi:hypothetical protein
MRTIMKNTLNAPSHRLAWPFAALLIAMLVGLSGCIQETESLSDNVVEADPATADMTTDYVVSGRDLYQTHCASCHGPEARGDGPMASVLTIPPPDLTRIQTKYDGTFPVDTLYRMIDGREEVPAHGTREMPIWGNAWRDIDGVPQSEETVEQRINVLIEYLRSIQVESDH